MIATSKPRILILGDHFWDRTIFYETQRESPEGGHPVVREVRKINGPGGAGAVVSACRSLGASAVGIGDRAGREVKVRHVVDGNVAFRCDMTQSESRLSDERVEILTLREIGNATILRSPDAIVVADYGKGVVTYATYAAIVELSQRLGVPLLVDPARGRPAEFYRGATAFFPNRNESGVHDRPVAFATEVSRYLGTRTLGEPCQCCCVKLDREGFAVWFRRGPQRVGRPDIPPSEVVDVSGAGDHFIAAAAVARASGSSWLNAIRAGNRAAGEKCRHWGAANGPGLSQVEESLLNLLPAISVK